MVAPNSRSKRRPDPASFLATIGEGRNLLHFHKGEIIYQQGDPADAIYFVEQGQIKASVLSEQGKVAVTAVLGPGSFFGEASVIGQAKRRATLTAMTECAIVRVENKLANRLIHEMPAFAESFIAHLVGRNLRVEADLVDQLFNSSEKRLARLLLLLANFGQEGGPKPSIDKISQETLADMIGTTRSRVSKFMNKFRKQGFIDYNGSIHVHSSLLNSVLHDHPEIIT